MYSWTADFFFDLPKSYWANCTLYSAINQNANPISYNMLRCSGNNGVIEQYLWMNNPRYIYRRHEQQFHWGLPKSNLHVIEHSEPVDPWLPLVELDEHLHCVPSQSMAIPYVPSNYSRSWKCWGMHAQWQWVHPGIYHCGIEPDLRAINLNYGELQYLAALPKRYQFNNTSATRRWTTNNQRQLSQPH